MLVLNVEGKHEPVYTAFQFLFKANFKILADLTNENNMETMVWLRKSDANPTAPSSPSSILDFFTPLDDLLKL